jgi:hypothetical protein
MTDLFTWADLNALAAPHLPRVALKRELQAEAREIRAEIRASTDPFEQDDLRFALQMVLDQLRALELSLA